MEQQLPMALQVALYAASVAIIVLTTFLIVVLFSFAYRSSVSSGPSRSSSPN